MAMEKNFPNYRVYGDYETDFSLHPVHLDDVNTSTQLNNWAIEPHRHDDLYHLAYFYGGDGVLYMKGEALSLKAPCFCAIPAGDVHSFYVEQTIQGYLMTISRSYLDELLESSASCLRLLDRPSYIHGGKRFFALIDPLFQQLKSEYTARKQARALIIRALISLVFSYLSRHEADNDRLSDQRSAEDLNLWYYRQFQNMIGYSVAEKRPVSDYAAELRISATHLNRVCRAVAGKSALKVIHDRLISEAKVNLAYTFQSVSEVAYKLGFDDTSYFSRFFKSHTGVSPSVFKARVRKPD
ncbi:helix-turn-helix domain-containing protein [Amphritea sp. RP18W]|uniref:Helix-turn-helix domain-containing protein n=2 Tax=Amphritea pacifica TaxID=2811233 RepID=A0ABS2W814_9GAMM|nr:helix-turn-helix domain-containing protein [Amphritea pacifica]